MKTYSTRTQLQKITKAITLLKTAKGILLEGAASTTGARSGTFEHFVKQIASVLSIDNGAAGLEAYRVQLEIELFGKPIAPKNCFHCGQPIVVESGMPELCKPCGDAFRKSPIQA